MSDAPSAEGIHYAKLLRCNVTLINAKQTCAITGVLTVCMALHLVMQKM